jgi:hypothetical protein
MLPNKSPALLFVAALIGTLLALPAPLMAQTEEEVLPFHSEVTWYRLDQVPVPEGRCDQPLPEGLMYLWVTREYGTATSTHLGTGPYYVEFCVFGLLTNSEATPPSNGVPMGFNAIVQVWTAANGDELRATGALIGIVTSPVFTFVDSLVFLGGGTGRFAEAEGQGTGFVYPNLENTQVGTEVYDGWIRYKRK